MTSEQIKIFKRFLKEIGVYSAFFRNMKTSRFDNSISIEDYLKIRRKDEVVSASFDWLFSPEGHAFWERVYKVWFSIDVNSPYVAEKLISFKKLKETLRSLRNKHVNAIL